MLRLFLIFCALAMTSFLSGKAAHAAPITGMVGVGTYNTQADFANVKVVQGTNTLYQSNFAAGMSEWTKQAGTWSTTADGVMHQTGTDTPARALVGSPTWSNYTLTLQARKTGGAEGFLITFGSPGDTVQTCWNIGGWTNTLTALQVPGVYDLRTANSVQTGVWYTIRVDVQGTDIRCYLNGTLVRDTARILDSSERTLRFQDLLSSPGYSLLNSAEQTWLNNLAGRTVYIGDAARATFAAMPSSGTFDALTAAQQVAFIRQVNRNRLTWNTGSGYGSDAGRDAAIIGSMDAAVILHNQLGLFDAQMTANNNPGTATADGNYNGTLNFGNLYSESTALHEISHGLGTGTFWKWNSPVAGVYGSLNGQWQGFYGNTQLDEFDGAGTILSCDTQHYWPYGLNYDSEFSTTNAYRHVFMVRALRRDMGIDTLNVEGSIAIANDTYVLVPRHAPGSALDVLNSGTGNGNPIDIHGYTGATNQKFLLDLQADGSYRIRTALAGNRCIDLPYGDTTNGNKLWLYDDNGNNAQRWYIIPMGDGWYRIAPKNNVYKAMDVIGVNPADGSLVDNYDYLDNLGQQWKLVPSSEAYTTTVPNGTYRLTPQNALGSALDVQNSGTGDGTLLDIHSYTGAANQQFLFDLQSDGTYRIRTALAGNRCLDLTNWDTTNGNRPQLYDDNGLSPQRWYVIPVGNGWYKIAPNLNIDKSLDVLGSGTADGTAVQDWDYLGGTNQLWSLTVPAPVVTVLSPAQAVAGSQSFTLTVTGANFTAASSVLWNGVAMTTTFVSATQLTATVPASAIATPGTSVVTVVGAPTPTSFTVAVPSLKFVRATVTRSGSNLTATVILSNTGAIGAPAVNVTAALMMISGKSASATGLPQSVGLIPSGGTGTVTLQFPNWGTASGTAVLRLSGTYAATGTFSTTGIGSILR